MTQPLRCTLSTLCLLVLCGGVRAQWTDDAAANTPVSTAASDQGQPKLVPAEGGGVWASWFDGIGSGWDVRLQRLGIGGVAQLGAGGVLVADRSFSSTQDYGLAAGNDGSALLAYRDDDGSGVFIAASKVQADGTLAWGAGGVALTGTAAFVAAPGIAGTDDGRALVGWAQDSGVMLQRLDADGDLVGGPIAFAPGVGSYSVADMHAVGDDVIVSFVHQLGGFGSPRHLLAQKIGAAGNLAWGAGHVSVFDGGSLQFGNFPDFSSDGAGGAVFSWYDTASPQLQCFAQRVLSNGTEAWAHNGVAVSTDATHLRVAPWASHDAASAETIVTWVELNGAQSQAGVYAQKLDAAGARQWSDAGALLVPLGSDGISAPLNMRLGAQSLVAWVQSSGFGQDQLLGVLLDGSGAIVGGSVPLATTASSKSRLSMTLTGAGHAALAWSDKRSDDGDIYAQNVNADGSLGPRWQDLGGGTEGLDGVPLLTCMGPLNAGSPLGAELSHAQPGGLALLWVSFASAPINIFGGTLHTLPVGFELLIVNDGSGGFAASTPFPAGVPSGAEMVFQFLCQDDAAPFNKTLTDGLLGTTP
ncbi:MAG: hypothetical protein DRQ55_14575 [Planctomycetota bacterium]|nr:MAG: hypothetical protein DRQ55_14575 [Planctomycetota bacterium]